MSDDRFKRILDFTLEWECEYDKNGKVRAEHDPDDPGGTTKYGIDQRSHPKVDIENLTYEQAKDIYYKSYWLKAQCDKMAPGFGEACFDMAVNSGIGQAGKLMQRGLKPLYLGEIDGKIGPLTIGATNGSSVKQLKQILEERDAFYYHLAGWGKNELSGKWEQQKVKVQNKYLRGWLNRNRQLKKLVGVT